MEHAVTEQVPAAGYKWRRKSWYEHWDISLLAEKWFRKRWFSLSGAKIKKIHERKTVWTNDPTASRRKLKKYW